MTRETLSFAVHTLLQELRQMKAEGMDCVSIPETTLETLRNQVAKYAAEAPPAPAPAAPPPQAPVASPVPLPSSPEPTPPPVPTATAPVPQTPAPIAQPTVSAPAPSPVRPSIIASGDLTPPVIELPDGSKQDRMDWLREKVLACPTCVANKNPGRQLAFGVGNLEADMLFVGEAPGEEEEKQGEPFVGPAGQKLNGMIKGMGLAREDVYIGNILKWRPRTESGFGNRAPSPQEMDFCLPYLKAQIAIIEPKVIVALGNTAIQGLLGHDTSLKVGRIHGNWYEFEGIPLLPTFHPSYILHNETKRTKRMVWEDLLKVMERLGLQISEKQRGYFL